MKLKEHVLERAKSYMQRKEYRLDRLQDNKVSKPKNMDITAEAVIPTYTMGDKVKLLDRNESAIVYRGLDSLNNLIVFVQGTMLEVHYKRVALELPSSDLYPEGYDLNTLFTSYQERKFQHDMQRGSKKALRKVQKEMRNQRRQETEGRD
jgi:hypothetical protein